MAINIDDIVDDMPMDPVVVIDIDAIDKDSEDDASNIVRDIAALFEDGDWLEKHPVQARRIKIELESLRGYIKMRRSDEQVHDALLQAIQSAPTNASLYRSLSEIQKTSLSVSTKINEAIQSLNNLMKEFQFSQNENPKDESGPVTESSEGEVTSRGSKDFIKQMLENE